MPKTKTHKGASKRLKKTGTGKIMHRKTGQSHFNSRSTSKKTTGKRRDMSMSKTNDKNIIPLIPYK
jgi:large subunit ribosomal protein L35